MYKIYCFFSVGNHAHAILNAAAPIVRILIRTNERKKRHSRTFALNLDQIPTHFKKMNDKLNYVGRRERIEMKE